MIKFPEYDGSERHDLFTQNVGVTKAQHWAYIMSPKLCVIGRIDHYNERSRYENEWERYDLIPPQPVANEDELWYED